MDVLYFLLKLLHVASAALWFGGAIFNLAILQPVMAKATYATRREAMGRFGHAVNKYLAIVGGLAFATGLLTLHFHPHLQGYGWGGLTTDAWGKTMLFVMLLAFFALYLGGAAMRPTLKAIAKIEAQMAPDQEPPANLRFLMARMRFTGVLIVALLATVFAAMVYTNVGP